MTNDERFREILTPVRPDLVRVVDLWAELKAEPPAAEILQRLEKHAEIALDGIRRRSGSQAAPMGTEPQQWDEVKRLHEWLVHIQRLHADLRALGWDPNPDRAHPLKGPVQLHLGLLRDDRDGRVGHEVWPQKRVPGGYPPDVHRPSHVPQGYDRVQLRKPGRPRYLFREVVIALRDALGPWPRSDTMEKRKAIASCLAEVFADLSGFGAREPIAVELSNEAQSS